MFATQQPRTRRRAILRAVLAGFATLVVLLGLDAALAGRQMLRAVGAARSHVTDGVLAVVAGDPAAARPSFEEAIESAASAEGSAGRPGLRLLSALPFLGDNVEAVEAVARASGDTAKAGLSMVNAAEILGWENILLPGAEAVGDVDLEAVRAARPELDELAKQLRRATDRLEASGGGRLVGSVAAGYERALEDLRRRTRLAAVARDLARLLPTFLGGTEPRRYLLGVQSLAVSRPTGGLLSAMGVLGAEGGIMTLEPLRVADEALASAATSPDLPTSAEAMLDVAAAGGVGGLDGMILVDTVGLEELLWMVGPVESEAWPRPLTMDDTVDILERGVFKGLDAEAAGARQARLISDAASAVLEGRPSAEAFAIAMARSVAGRHLVVYSTETREQTLLDRLGATGVFEPGRNPLAVAWDDPGTNRAGQFVRRSITHLVTLDESGSARVKTTVEIRNDAATKPPSVLLGRPFGLGGVGEWGAKTLVYLPERARKIRAETSTPSETNVIEGEGVPVVSARLFADPGGSMSLIVGYRAPKATTGVGSGREYRLVVSPQPSIAPTTVRLRIVVPDGMQVTSASEDLTVGGSTVRFEGAPEASLELWVRYA